MNKKVAKTFITQTYMDLTMHIHMEESDTRQTHLEWNDET